MQDEWKKFLQQSGAIIEGETVKFFSNPEDEARAVVDGNIITNLSGLSAIRVSGGDATGFLHGQFSSDIQQLADFTGQFSAWCNPKGRMVANFLFLRLPDCFLVILRSDLLEKFLQRLQMYVLRSDVIIEDLRGETVIIGLQGETVPGLLSRGTGKVPQNAYAVTRNDGTVIARLPDPVPRMIVMGPPAGCERLWTLTAGELTPVGTDQWVLADILGGLAWVDSQTSEKFLPVEFNMDYLGGISYSKGCFPGQEILARLRNRGNVKQRLHTALVKQPAKPKPGDRLINRSDSQPAGTIIQSALHPEHGHAVIALIDTSLAGTDSVTLEATAAGILQFLPQRYPDTPD